MQKLSTERNLLGRALALSIVTFAGRGPFFVSCIPLRILCWHQVVLVTNFFNLFFFLLMSSLKLALRLV
ncbi:hypothetical protein DTO166G4_5747 [Paecilomyces variotii]|nr:hypothetical protein DTO032I3_3310 [Paecilomyces variotii]KAJ9204998.1 hypothetical protein DTO164E3_1621 [Paecilomyces variotii]KAJ9212676.1 hypothetical protein DTO166G4_5747 [Paecilomyces variotii]KAJ9243030.1 hypothetical protein DTO166G5_134 [Paecilomyces variotii]KAJ9277283.1 hypothetical protein DTO021D3_5748 [Paecilomyces variotii]